MIVVLRCGQAERMKHLALALLVFGCTSQPIEATPDASGPDASPDAALPNGVATIPLIGCSWSYVGAFTIGDASFHLTIDTGSNVIAVAGTSCATCTAAGITDLYTPGTTAVDKHEMIGAEYDDGDISWSGEAYEDEVAAGGVGARVEIGDIATQTDFLSSQECGDADGILGIGGSGDASLMTQLAQAGVTDVFALHYCPTAGTMWLAGFDPAVATATPTYVPMTIGVATYYIDVTDFAVGGVNLGLPSTTYGPAVVDSGGPNIFVPPAAYTAITTAIAESPLFQAQFGDATWFANETDDGCVKSTSTKAELDAGLPTLSVVVNGTSVAMAATSSYLMTYEEADGTYYCPALVSSPSFLDLGNSLIRSNLVVFDRAAMQMGFAPTAACL